MMTSFILPKSFYEAELQKQTLASEIDTFLEFTDKLRPGGEFYQACLQDAASFMFPHEPNRRERFPLEASKAKDFISTWTLLAFENGDWHWIETRIQS